MGPLNTPHDAVMIFWTNKDGKLKERTFTDAYKARRYYARKLREDCDPYVRNANEVLKERQEALEARKAQLKANLDYQGIDWATL